MKRITVDWKPGRRMPDGVQREWVAKATIDGEPYALTLKDSTSYTSGRRYISLTVHAPHQGRGNGLRMEVNGVSLSLRWNGGNRPKWPRRTKTADYATDLTPAQVARLKGQKPPRLPDPKPAPTEQHTGPDPERVIEATWRQRWIWWRGSISKGPAWATKLTMKANTQVRLFGEKATITKDWIWINGVRLQFRDIGRRYCICSIDGLTARRIRAAR